MRAMVTAFLGVLVGVAAASGAESENSVICRMSAPATCFVSAHPQAQAQYRWRCQQTPAMCKFRPDGTIEQWTGYTMPSDSVVEELRYRTDNVLATLRASQEAK